MKAPLESLLGLLNGYRISQALSVVTRLGIADHLKNGPKTPNELSKLISVQPGPLYQVLRTVASYGVFTEDTSGRFIHTPMSEYLCSDAPGAARTTGLLIGEVLYETFGDMMYAVQSGKPAFDKAFGQSFFDYLSAHDNLGRLFDDHMTTLYTRQMDSLLAVYDFGRTGKILDVGGGRGTAVRTLLARYPNLACGLFDLPAVTARTRESFAAEGLLTRCTIEVGSFFEAVPGGYDTYLLKHVLHDWDESACKIILSNIRRAVGERGLLLVLEHIVPSGNGPSTAKDFDLGMLCLFAGRERTEEEYRALLKTAGFVLERIVPSEAQIHVLEARPA
jgi:O-methyltransferase domain